MTSSIEILALVASVALILALVKKLIVFVTKNLVNIAIGCFGLIAIIQGLTTLNVSVIDFLELLKPFIGREVMALLIQLLTN